MKHLNATVDFKPGAVLVTKGGVTTEVELAPLTEDELNDPRIIDLCREMVRLGKQQANNERDHYRALLEARVSGLEALLNAIVQQIPRGHGDVHLTDNINKALVYLAGNGKL